MDQQIKNTVDNYNTKNKLFQFAIKPIEKKEKYLSFVEVDKYIVLLEFLASKVKITDDFIQRIGLTPLDLTDLTRDFLTDSANSNKLSNAITLFEKSVRQTLIKKYIDLSAQEFKTTLDLLNKKQ